MPDPGLAMSSSMSDDEAFEALKLIAGRRTLPLPTEMLVRHTLALPGPWDWPVRRAAFEALLRRLASARSQELTVIESPRRGPLGRYALGSPQVAGLLSYDVRLLGLDPVEARCDCADFLRSSLGLCKHVLAVVDHLARKPREWKKSQEAGRLAPPELAWDATQVPAGPFDPLSALMLTSAESGLAGLFRAGKKGRLQLVTLHASDAKARLCLVDKLQKHAKGASADPAARAVLADERARLERVARLQAARPRLVHASNKSKRHLYSYQKQGVARILAEGRLVLADDMGLGKTTQAIVASSALLEAGLAQRGLLIVPASLKPQWEREWQAVSHSPLRVVDGNAEERRALYASTRRGFLVTNYEQVVRDFDAIAAWNPDLVVLDEAQRIKNWSTRTALTVKRLRPTYRLVLTGTPMENRLEELASIVEWVDDRALEPKWRLAPWHSTFADGKREVVGARNLDTLRARLEPVLLRRVRAEVLTQLPKRQDTVIPVDMTEEQREAHDGLNQPIAKLAAIAGRRALSPAEFLRLMSLLATQRVISNGMAQLNFETIWPDIRAHAPTPKLIASLATPKLIELRELIANLTITQNRKVVVFSQWRRMLELAAWSVSDVLAAQGLRTLFFTGQEGIRRRTQNLVDFHDDPQAAVLFLSDAGGVGLNLQRAANACINLELPWNPAVLEQRIGRIHRIGQKRPIDVYNLVSCACIEERIAGIVSDKRALFRGLFEGASDEIKFERSSSLLHVLERLAVSQVANTQPAEEPESSLDAPTSAASASEVEQMVAAAEPSRPDASEPIAESVPMPSLFVAESAPLPVARLFDALRVERGADGSLRIEAPPAAASALASLFDGMARLLSAVGGAPTTEAGLQTVNSSRFPSGSSTTLS
jgi:superfamily II DNA or RNA helicase